MTTIGNYVYRELLGRGSTANVYRGTHVTSGEVVAVKKFNKNMVGKLFLERISSEVSLLKRLTHSHIVGYRDMIESKNHFYLICELCNGGDLKTFLQSSGALSQLEAKYYFGQLRSAIQYLSSLNIVHRDIKPQNILLHFRKPRTSLLYDFKDVQLKLVDFGFAKEVNTPDMNSTLCGSPMFMAPEIICESRIHARSDLWSIGVILYKAVFGTYPYGEPTNLLELSRVMTNFTVEIPQRISCCIHLRDLIERLLQQDPIDRIDWSDFFDHPWFDCDSYNCNPANAGSSSDSDSIDDTDWALGPQVMDDLKRRRPRPEAIIKMESRPRLINDYCDRNNISMSIPVAVPISIKKVTIVSRQKGSGSFSDSFYKFVRRYAPGGTV